MSKAITLSGSIRADSSNTLLAKAIGDKLALAGVEVANISLKDYPLALFNEDNEAAESKPQAAVELATLFAQADIIFIASPEYNGSLSPLLKNSLDWVSRQKIGSYQHATFGIGAASPGKMGGVGGLGHLREILGKLGALIVPLTLGLGGSFNAFDAQGRFVDDAISKRADNLVKQLISISRN